MALSVANAELGGTLWEAVAYGVYVALLPEGARVLLRGGHKGAIPKYFIATLVVSFLAITVHLAADIAQVIVGFTSEPDQIHFVDHFYSIVNDRFNVLKMAGYVTTTIIMDFLIVFRTYTIWNRDWRAVLFPAVLCCADVGKSIWIVCAFSLNSHPPSTGVFSTSLQLLAFFALTLGLNFVCTSLIVYKIWKARRLTDRYLAVKNRRLSGALALIIESASLYTMLLFVALILAVTRSNALYIIFNMLPPMIGIIFLYVILRSANNNRNTTEVQSTIIGTNSTRSGAPMRSGNLDSPPQSVHLNASPTSLKAPSLSIRLEGIGHVMLDNPESDRFQVSDKRERGVSDYSSV